jgi:hypothetical protein
MREYPSGAKTSLTILRSVTGPRPEPETHPERVARRKTKEERCNMRNKAMARRKTRAWGLTLLEDEAFYSM